MKPEREGVAKNLSFLEVPLEKIVNKEHELVVLSKRIDWKALEERFGKY